MQSAITLSSIGIFFSSAFPTSLIGVDSLCVDELYHSAIVFCNIQQHSTLSASMSSWYLPVWRPMFQRWGCLLGKVRHKIEAVPMQHPAKTRVSEEFFTLLGRLRDFALSEFETQRILEGYYKVLSQFPVEYTTLLNPAVLSTIKDHKRKLKEFEARVLSQISVDLRKQIGGEIQLLLYITGKMHDNSICMENNAEQLFSLGQSGKSLSMVQLIYDSNILRNLLEDFAFYKVFTFVLDLTILKLICSHNPNIDQTCAAALATEELLIECQLQCQFEVHNILNGQIDDYCLFLSCIEDDVNDFRERKLKAEGNEELSPGWPTQHSTLLAEWRVMTGMWKQAIERLTSAAKSKRAILKEMLNTSSEMLSSLEREKKKNAVELDALVPFRQTIGLCCLKVSSFIHQLDQAHSYVSNLAECKYLPYCKGRQSIIARNSPECRHSAEGFYSRELQSKFSFTSNIEKSIRFLSEIKSFLKNIPHRSEAAIESLQCHYSHEESKNRLVKALYQIADEPKELSTKMQAIVDSGLLHSIQRQATLLKSIQEDVSSKLSKRQKREMQTELYFLWMTSAELYEFNLLLADNCIKFDRIRSSSTVAAAASGGGGFGGGVSASPAVCEGFIDYFVFIVKMYLKYFKGFKTAVKDVNQSLNAYSISAEQQQQQPQPHLTASIVTKRQLPFLLDAHRLTEQYLPKQVPPLMADFQQQWFSQQKKHGDTFEERCEALKRVISSFDVSQRILKEIKHNIEIVIESHNGGDGHHNYEGYGVKTEKDNVSKLYSKICAMRTCNKLLRSNFELLLKEARKPGGSNYTQNQSELLNSELTQGIKKRTKLSKSILGLLCMF